MVGPRKDLANKEQPQGVTESANNPTDNTSICE